MKKFFKSLSQKLDSMDGMDVIVALASFAVVGFAIYFMIGMGRLLWSDFYEEAERKAQLQTPMDEKYVGLRWISEGGTRAEMYFDVFEEGEPPRGVCIFDGKEYEVILVGPFGREGWDSRDYYVLDAETELTGEEPESFLFRGSLHWRVGKAAFYYTFDNGEEHITLLDFRPVKIPVEALDGA